MIHGSIDNLASNQEEGMGHLANAETVEAQALQNLLPDEDDLFSGLIDEMKSTERVLNGPEMCTGSLENRSIHFLHSAKYMPEVGLNKYQTSGRSISTPENTLASSVRTTSFGTCIALPERSHFLHQLGNVSVNDLTTANGNHPCVMGSTDQDIEFPIRVPGLSRTGNYLACEQYQADTNSYWNNHSTQMVWPSSSFVIHEILPGYPQLPAHSGTPIGSFNKVSPPQYPCVGSAPSATWSLQDKKDPHTPEFPELLSFCSNSFGNYLINHPLEIDSGGKCNDVSTSNAWCNPHQIGHIFSSRTGLNSVPNYFKSSPKRVKNLSQRRNHGSFPHADIKQFELDIDRVLHGEDYRTTLMIKNIPNKYTSKMLLDVIDEQCQGKYDFIYLPIDFKNNCNVGYAFINLIHPQHIVPFYKAFNGRKWDKFNSEKMVVLAYARIQGKTALISHFQNSSLMNEDKRCRPILFCTDGPRAGEQEAFPSRTSGKGKNGKKGSNFMEENENGQQ